MPSNLNLDYYYGNEAEQYSFYRIPKALLTDPRYKSVSIEAKVLYGLLLGWTVTAASTSTSPRRTLWPL